MNESNIELDFSLDLDVDHPKCRHGPTLLFRSGNERFFACSACRDRRDCQIYVPVEQDKPIKVQREFQYEYKNFKKLVRTSQKKSKKPQGRFCYTCSVVFVNGEKSEHVDHHCTDRLTREEFRHPCRSVLQALEEKRSNAQFFFSQSLIDYLIEKIIRPGRWDSVICIGCPTIFENLPKINSFLLDYDHRLCSFYSSKKMLVFNMFNGHIFSREKFFREKFLPTIERCLVIVDPPFGGFHRALSFSLDRLFQSTNIERNLILFNPYFLGKWLVQSFPQLKMLDYKVEYSSNSSLHLCRGKKGSPVRMFTDISPSQCPPLDDDNYKFCLECDRYTLINNQHCHQCGICPSKDGLPSRHCSFCQRCVKRERKHCFQCNVCHLPEPCRLMTSGEKRKSSNQSDQQRKKVGK